MVVDEAHNSCTELAFDMLARFRPSGVMELTATPDLERTPSNVLHSVSAAELKAEEMIKLPVLLETEPNWQQCLADAIGRRNALQKLADEERRKGSDYLRRLVLLQYEPRRAGVDTLDFDRVRQELISNHRIPDDEIIVATGEERGLEKVDTDYKLGIADPACPVKFVITQRALAEGWDCWMPTSMGIEHGVSWCERGSAIGRGCPNTPAFLRSLVGSRSSHKGARRYAEFCGSILLYYPGGFGCRARGLHWGP